MIEAEPVKVSVIQKSPAPLTLTWKTPLALTISSPVGSLGRRSGPAGPKSISTLWNGIVHPTPPLAPLAVRSHGSPPWADAGIDARATRKAAANGASSFRMYSLLVVVTPPYLSGLI